MSAKVKAKFQWNTGQRKMIVCVHSAKNVTEGKPVHELTVKVKANKKTVTKTPKSIKSANPVWSHFVFFETCPTSLMFLLGDGSKKEFGQFQMNEIQTFSDDQLHTVEGELTARKAKQKVTGSITIRFFITKLPDRRSAFTGTEKKMYFYDNYNEFFKTGDLILYSGRSPLDVVLQLNSGVPYSHVGMIVEVPNPITDKRSLYVLEVTQDLDGMIDMLTKTPKNGINMFPLHERFHNYFGNAIWWLPRSEQLDLRSENSLLKYMTALHMKTNPANVTPSPILPENLTDFLLNFGYSLKYPETLPELWGPILMINTLEQGVVYTVPTISRATSTIRLNKEHMVKKGLEYTSPFPEWSEARKASICVEDLTKLKGFATQYLVCCSSSLNHYVLDKSLKYSEVSEGVPGVNQPLLGSSLLFDAPLLLSKATTEAQLERQKRVQNMIINEGQGLNALGEQGSQSDDIISESEGEDEALEALRKQALIQADRPDNDDSEETGSSLSLSNSGLTPIPPAGAQAPTGQPNLANSGAPNPFLTSPPAGPNLSSSGPIAPNPFLNATPAEPQFPWKEYTAQDGTGRIYYHNAAENKSIWVPPPGWEEYKAQLAVFHLAKSQQSEAARHSISVSQPRNPIPNPFASVEKQPEQFPQQIAAFNPFLNN